jgi:hypothetical protein
MNPWPLIAGLVGVVFLAGAVRYWFVPWGVDAGGVPHFHVTRAIVSLIIALVLFAFAWYQSRRGGSGVQPFARRRHLYFPV